ncbi:MAG: acyltransferase, partial [Pseudomonadota bacterium]
QQYMLAVEGDKLPVQNSFKVNNFDIIRLIAALQVVIHHTLLYFDVEHIPLALLSILSYFPGVPIFFFVSGFLISKSYENNFLIKEYASNRILRIYPALIICTLVTIFSIYLTGYLSNRQLNIIEFIFWIVGQISFFQFYNPEFMREFGTGVINGSLWTITVELQFYFIVPIIYYVFGLAKQKNTNRNLLILISIFMLFHMTKYSFSNEYDENLLFKLFGVSFIPWIWMFLVGVLFQKNFIAIHKILSGKVLYILPLYLLISFYSTTYFGWSMGNGIHPILFISLAFLVFSFAYSFPTLSQKLLKRNDISYGVYIYHIPVINMLLYYGYTTKLSYVFFVILITLFLAGLSWFIFEKNSMKLKKHPLNPLNTANKVI